MTRPISGPVRAPGQALEESAPSENGNHYSITLAIAATLEHGEPNDGIEAELHQELSGKNQGMAAIAHLRYMGPGASLTVPYGAFCQDPVICLFCRIL